MPARADHPPELEVGAVVVGARAIDEARAWRCRDGRAASPRTTPASSLSVTPTSAARCARRARGTGHRPRRRRLLRRHLRRSARRSLRPGLRPTPQYSYTTVHARMGWPPRRQGAKSWQQYERTPVHGCRVRQSAFRVATGTRRNASSVSEARYLRYRAMRIRFVSPLDMLLRRALSMARQGDFTRGRAGSDGRLSGARGARPVEVQCQLAPGVPQLRRSSACPTRRSAKAASGSQPALAAMGLALPPKRITLNLSPADLPKEGSALRLADRAGAARRRWA